MRSSRAILLLIAVISMGVSLRSTAEVLTMTNTVISYQGGAYYQPDAAEGSILQCTNANNYKERIVGYTETVKEKMNIDYSTMSIGSSGREALPMRNTSSSPVRYAEVSDYSWTAHYEYDPFDHHYPNGHFIGFINQQITKTWSVDNSQSICQIRWSVLATPNRLLARPKASKKKPPTIPIPPSQPTNPENPELPSPAEPPMIYTPCLCAGYAPPAENVSPMHLNVAAGEQLIASACDCSGKLDSPDEEQPCDEEGEDNPATELDPMPNESEPPVVGDCGVPADKPVGVIALPQPIPADLGPVVAEGDDIDDDGKPDLIIGTPDANHTESKLKKVGSITVISSETLQRLKTLHGEQPNANFAAQILTYDINSDGQLEIIVTAPLFDDKERKLKDTGTVFIYDLNLQEIKRFYGKTRNERFGSSITIGDINNDNEMDLIIGASNANNPINGAKAAGKVIVYDGISDTVLAEYYGDSKGAAFGSAISAGHVNGDLYVDLLVGAPFETQGKLKKAGSISVIFGNDARPTLKKYGQVINANLGYSVQLGDLNGDKYTDIIASAPNDTRIQPTTLVKAGSVWAWSGKEADHPLLNKMPIYGTAKNMRLGVNVHRAYLDSDDHLDLLIQLGINDALTPVYGSYLQQP